MEKRLQTRWRKVARTIAVLILPALMIMLVAFFWSGYLSRKKMIVDSFGWILPKDKRPVCFAENITTSGPGGGCSVLVTFTCTDAELTNIQHQVQQRFRDNIWENSPLNLAAAETISGVAKALEVQIPPPDARSTNLTYLCAYPSYHTYHNIVYGCCRWLCIVDWKAKRIWYIDTAH